MSYAHNRHYEWIESSLKVKCSELGKDVANIIGFVGRGIYNAPINRKKVEWNNPYYIEVLWGSYLSNYDFSKLSELLIECFDRMIRVSVNPCNFRYLKLQFWKRNTRDMNESISVRLPNIEYMIELQRKLFNREV